MHFYCRRCVQTCSKPQLALDHELTIASATSSLEQDQTFHTLPAHRKTESPSRVDDMLHTQKWSRLQSLHITYRNYKNCSASPFPARMTGNPGLHAARLAAPQKSVALVVQLVHFGGDDAHGRNAVQEPVAQ